MTAQKHTIESAKNFINTASVKWREAETNVKTLENQIFDSYVLRSQIICEPDIQLSLHHLLPVNHKFGQRLYCASSDGYSASDFHRKCDKKGKTFTIIRS